jgi:tetratricopeptide (TPR) repeat protein
VLQRRGKEAVELYDRALRIQESALGAEHVEVASTLGNLGRCLGRLGRLPEAEEACRRAAAIQARILGQNHPETRQSLAHLDNLANLGYPLQGKELAGSSGVVASGVVPALALDGASVPSTAPPTESDSMAGRIAAKRRARRKQFAPSRPLGAPTVSMLDALEKQQEEDKAARKEAIKDFWRANVRG